MADNNSSRRRLLRAAGIGFAGLLAGCSDNSSFGTPGNGGAGGGSPETPAAPGTPSPTASPTPTPSQPVKTELTEWSFPPGTYVNEQSFKFRKWDIDHIDANWEESSAAAHKVFKQADSHLKVTGHSRDDPTSVLKLEGGVGVVLGIPSKQDSIEWMKTEYGMEKQGTHRGFDLYTNPDGRWHVGINDQAAIANLDGADTPGLEVTRTVIDAKTGHATRAVDSMDALAQVMRRIGGANALSTATDYMAISFPRRKTTTLWKTQIKNTVAKAFHQVIDGEMTPSRAVWLFDSADHATRNPVEELTEQHRGIQDWQNPTITRDGRAVMLEGTVPTSDLYE